MVVSKKSYEDLRKQRLEENKKRMEQLNIPQLTQALKTAHSPMKRTKLRAIGTEMVVVRRSSRVASLPSPVYKEHGLNTFERFDLPRRISVQINWMDFNTILAISDIALFGFSYVNLVYLRKYNYDLFPTFCDLCIGRCTLVVYSIVIQIL